MQKTIYSLPALRELMEAANRRYLEFLSAIEDPRAGRNKLDKLSQPVEQEGRRYIKIDYQPEDGFDIKADAAATRQRQSFAKGRIEARMRCRCGKSTRTATGRRRFYETILWYPVCSGKMIPMSPKALVCLLLLTFASFAAPTASANLLGEGYSEWLAATTQMATDNSGALYLLGSCQAASGTASCVTKLSADGNTILWQDALSFQTNTMAVSPAGDVFVLPASQPGGTSLYVAKLGAGGSGVAWQVAAGFLPVANAVYVPVLTADSQGRAYVTALSSSSGVATVVRINAEGSGIDYSATITGSPTAIAADGTGAVVVAGWVNTEACFVARVAASGSIAYYTSLAQNEQPALALDPSGNAVIVGSQGGFQGVLQRLNAAGSVTVSTIVTTYGAGLSPLGLDSAGNAYILGATPQLAPLQNTLAPCLPTTQLPAAYAGIAPVLTVVAPDGSIQQTTYVPQTDYNAPGNGNVHTSTLLLAVSPNSTVLVASGPAPGFVPTQQGPFPQTAPPGQAVLVQLSPQPAAQAIPLTCVLNAATYLSWPVAPGEIVALMGSGLGPIEGAQTQATLQSPFPQQISSVQVTFDGKPSPLLWVQNSQINAIVPWSLTPESNTQICVSYGSAQTNCLTWPVAETAPGVFTVDGTHAAAVNQDGTINSAGNPAAPGSIVSVYATGLGPISPAQADGTLVALPLPSNAVQTGVVAEEFSVGVGPLGCNCYLAAPVPVTFDGPAAYLVAGASQINFQLPTASSTIQDPSGYYLTLPSINSPVFAIYMAGQ
jgi:uncharacterized protein (TIGR03437 family)